MAFMQIEPTLGYVVFDFIKILMKRLKEYSLSGAL